jgi:hypothetical protein
MSQERVEPAFPKLCSAEHRCPAGCEKNLEAKTVVDFYEVSIDRSVQQSTVQTQITITVRWMEKL